MLFVQGPPRRISYKIDLAILNPIQIPIKPPITLNIKDDNEKKLAPHSFGIKPPIVEPTNKPIHIKDFVFIVLLIYFIRKLYSISIIPPRIFPCQHAQIWQK